MIFSREIPKLPECSYTNAGEVAHLFCAIFVIISSWIGVPEGCVRCLDTLTH